MRRVAISVVCILAIVLGVGLSLKGVTTRVPSGTWATAGSLLEVRSGASAVSLADGRILITGGSGLSGVLASAELYNGWGFSAAAAMSAARSRHTSTLLRDGRVLVTGGRTFGDALTSTAEVYDPATNSWSGVGSMLEARAGQTASRLHDGRVLIAGGEGFDGVSATLEVFDPATNSFSLAGRLSSPRKEHAAVALADGRVLVVGGSNGSEALASADLYDPASGFVFPAAGSLSLARAGLSATMLLDGRVLIAGGNNGSADLASGEIYDPVLGMFLPVGRAMLVARRDHLAFRLPDNNSVLIVGGTSSGASLSTAELFVPWRDAFEPTGSQALTRSGAIGSPLKDRGYFFMAGGSGVQTAAIYGFPTVSTDKADYVPGDIVTVTGTGWQPGETVKFLLHEDPTTHADREWTVTTDAAGNFTDRSFVVEAHDLGVTFYLTATGQSSGLTAQTTFRDGSLALSLIPSSVTVTAGGSSASFTIRGTVTGSVGSGRSFTVNTVYTITGGICTASSPVTVSVASQSGGATTNYDTSASVSASSIQPAGSFSCSVGATANNPSSATGSALGQPTNVNLSVTVNAANTAPTANDGGPYNVNEGGSVQLNGSGSDPDVGDTLTFTWDLNNDGTFETSGAAPTFSAVGRDGPDSQIIVLKVCDSKPTPACTTDSTTVTINNLAPTATLSNNGPVNEGSAATISFSNQSDPSSADTAAGFHYAFACDNGSLAAATYAGSGASASTTCTFNDNGTYTVRARIIDKDGGFTEYTTDVTVNNVPPTATLSNNGPVNEGSAATISFSNQSDPSSADTAAGFHYAFACDNGSLAAATYAGSSASASTTCTFNDNGTYTVRARIIDKDGGLTEYTTDVTVNNVPPTVSFNISANPINENDTITLNGTITDPGILDTHSVVINWGDGSTSTGLSLAANVLSFSATHKYLDDNPSGTSSDTYTIMVTVTDKDLGTGSASTPLTVNNVAPAISSVTGPAGPIALSGNAPSVTVNFSDVGTQDTHTCTFSWDDSTSSTATASGPSNNRTCTGTHTYAAAGVYTIGVTVTDDDTGSASSVFQYIVIYDPSAGFVTGGGWIMSLAGAYAADPSLSGKATFGFVSKYQKGANIPTGNTEFQFHVANFNFKSTVYEWLVVAGFKAQYKGSGTVNGTGDYGFILTAYDGEAPGGGSVDKFRIKIVNKSTGLVVYDNKLGVSDDIDSADPQAISGGSIVIHSK